MLLKKKDMFEYITDDIEIFSNDSAQENSDEEILKKKIKYRT